MNKCKIKTNLFKFDLIFTRLQSLLHHFKIFTLSSDCYFKYTSRAPCRENGLEPSINLKICKFNEQFKKARQGF
jgi:hypothetical protein